MQADSIFTRRRFGIDINVLLVMLLAILLCAGLVSYKLIGNKTKCLPFTISATGYNNQKNNNYLVNETVKLNTSLPISTSITWDFGDGTPITNGNSTLHVFLRAGKFTVTALQNEQCSQTMDIVIKAPLNPHHEPIFYDPIEGNASPVAGVTERYTCKIAASSYEWTVTNAKLETKKGIEVSYQFPLAQTYELQVKLDNDPLKIHRKTIFVNPAIKPIVTNPDDVHRLVDPVIPPHSNPPVTDNSKTDPNNTDNTTTDPVVTKKDPNLLPQPNIDKPKTKLIANESFQSMLEDLVKGNGEIEQFIPYLAYGINTPVRENDKWTKFSDLYNHLKSKKIEITKVELHREENNNVQNIEIQYKKINFFKRLMH